MSPPNLLRPATAGDVDVVTSVFEKFAAPVSVSVPSPATRRPQSPTRSTPVGVGVDRVREELRLRHARERREDARATDRVRVRELARQHDAILDPDEVAVRGERQVVERAPRDAARQVRRASPRGASGCRTRAVTGLSLFAVSTWVGVSTPVVGSGRNCVDDVARTTAAAATARGTRCSPRARSASPSATSDAARDLADQRLAEVAVVLVAAADIERDAFVSSDSTPA